MCCNSRFSQNFSLKIISLPHYFFLLFLRTLYFLSDVYFFLRYGAPGYSETEVRQDMVDLDKHLQAERFKYAWISSANVEYEESLAQIHFLSNIHAKVLDIKFRD